MALFRGPCCLHLPTRTNAQMAARTLPNVGYATNADHGAGCNIHPPAKQITGPAATSTRQRSKKKEKKWCGTRLANSALALQYGHKVAWKSPSFAASLGAVVVSPQLGGGEFERKGLSSHCFGGEFPSILFLLCLFRSCASVTCPAFVLCARLGATCG